MSLYSKAIHLVLRVLGLKTHHHKLVKTALLT